MRRPLAAAVLVLLAGCSSKEGGSNTSAAAGAAQETAPANLTQDPTNSAVPVTLPTPQPVTAIPAAFQGRWGQVGADCDPAKAFAAKGLLTIAGNQLSFYESRGTAAHLKQISPARLSFDLPMSGEGMTWSEPTTLTIDDAGRTLIRQATGSPDRAGVFTYQKCPA